MAIDSPFVGEVAEVPLPRAPLAKVIAQVRFPLVTTLGQQESIGPFQEALRPKYPILRQDHEMGLIIGPAGVVPQPEKGGVVWRLHDKSNVWRVSLAPTFIALETDSYTSRDDFFARFDEALSILNSVFSLAVYDRLGVRYVDRLAGTERLKELPKYVRAELLGMIAIANRPDGPALQHSVAETMYGFGGSANMLARCALLPPRATFDPSIPPVEEHSWLLDLDMFTTQQKDFDVDAIGTLAREFAAHSYRFFRWAVTDAFLREFGGEV